MDTEESTTAHLLPRETLRTPPSPPQPPATPPPLALADDADIDESDLTASASSLVAAHLTPDDFTVLKLLGTGGFAKVYLVQHAQTGVLYAMKVMSKMFVPKRPKAKKGKAAAKRPPYGATVEGESSGTPDPSPPSTPTRDGQQQPKIFRDGMIERDLLASINEHPFLITLRYAFQDTRHLYLVLDWAQGGEMWEYVNAQGRCKENEAKFYIAEILLALEHLHSLQIIYRDVKMENVLIDGNGHIKLTDFGLAKFAFHADLEGQANSFVGTFDFMAPEMILRKPYDERVDHWGLGCLAFSMMTGGPPFPGKTPKDVEIGITTRKPKFPAYLTRDAISFMSQLLQKSADDRPTWSKLKTHPWFRGIDWPALAALQVPAPAAPSADTIKGEVKRLLRKVRRVHSVVAEGYTAARATDGGAWGDLAHPIDELDRVFANFAFPASPAGSPQASPALAPTSAAALIAGSSNSSLRDELVPLDEDVSLND
ncbi:kinase-like domain-containing protein [Blastocladiella britannica]|nr:kinase-like domain-containing protein [Blastocladiella britannica]